MEITLIILFPTKFTVFHIFKGILFPLSLSNDKKKKRKNIKRERKKR